MKQCLNALVIVLVLGIYLIGTSQIDNLHQVFHSHKELVAHSPVEEKNSCHRSIYHDDLQKKCGHQSHIIITNTCDLCDVIGCSIQEIPAITTFITSEVTTVHFPIYVSRSLRNNDHQLSSRAPPIS